MTGADFGGQGGQCPLQKNLLIITATINSMKISFNDV